METITTYQAGSRVRVAKEVEVIAVVDTSHKGS